LDYLATYTCAVTTSANTTISAGTVVAVLALLAGLWSSASILDNNWRWHKWFGYFNVAYDPWIFHDQHGWLYCAGDTTGSIWIWDSTMGSFWWTSDSVYPYLYRASDEAWLWYQEGSSGPRWFNNINTGGWESW
jgi:hypothetical protein